MTVFYFRLAFPWACFLAVFLGIPLATKNERTGSLLAVITAVVLIVAYIVVAQIFQVLGKGGVIPPLVAGLAPTVVFIFCGAFRLISQRN
jgi:lipopolysaccharide export LptBFGC system permease protein LptF